MSSYFPRSTVRIARHPIYPMLMPFPFVCFIGTLATDIAYWQTANIIWSHFSSWLLAAGLFTGILAALACLIDFFGDSLVRMQGPALPHLVGNFLVLIVAFLDILVHARDGWTAVVPMGLILSAIVVLILLFTAWQGWTMVYRHGMGVDE